MTEDILRYIEFKLERLTGTPEEIGIRWMLQDLVSLYNKQKRKQS